LTAKTDGNQPQEDFLIACKALDLEYATSCLREIFKHEARGTTKEISLLETYVAEMTTYLRCTKPHSTGLAVSAAELGITKPTETTSTGRGHRGSTRPTPTCICGNEHWYTECFILNPRHPAHPKFYQPTAEAVLKVEEARKDSKMNARIKNALERWAARQPQSARSLRVDDGKPPVNTNTFVISSGSSLSAHGHNGHDGHDGHGVTAINALTEPVGTLTTMTVDDTTQNNLLERWIVDPGSNTHVVNSEAWKDWKRTTDNPERRSINTDNSCILLTAWGTMELVARTPHGQLTLKLTHVAYVEGFITSVLGLARCRTESIHFDSGRDILYMHQPTNVIAQLEYNGGHWLIDAELSRRPPLSLLHSPLSTFGASYRPSYAPKPTNVVD
jgi:hypothetical protein